MQSDVLSGGLQTNLFAHLGEANLSLLEADASKGSLSDVLVHIAEAKKNLQHGSPTNVLTDQDSKWLDIIKQGRNEFTDLACESLLIAAQAKVNPVDASKYSYGLEQGMFLTRAAFAIMTKFSQLGGTFSALEDAIEMEMITSPIPKEKGKAQKDAFLKIIKTVEKSDELIKLWANASKMRSWLSSKKQELGERLANQENSEELLDKELDAIIKQIEEKAEFLVALQPPAGTYKVEEPEELVMLKKPSYMLS